MKVPFSLATIAFDRESAQMSQMLSSQGKNAPSDPYPHYLVRLAASRGGHHEEIFFEFARMTPVRGQGDCNTRFGNEKNSPKPENPKGGGGGKRGGGGQNLTRRNPHVEKRFPTPHLGTFPTPLPSGPEETDRCRGAKIAARQFLSLTCLAITLTAG